VVFQADLEEELCTGKYHLHRKLLFTQEFGVVVFQADLEEKLARLEELLQKQPGLFIVFFTFFLFALRDLRSCFKSNQVSFTDVLLTCC